MPKSKATTRHKSPANPKTALMNQLLALLDDVEDTPSSRALDKAQELVFDAWDAPQKRARIALARAALNISADCADAYLILAREAKTPQETIALLREGVAAGERALSKKAFENGVGMFWGLLETRPYMRARHALAIELWDNGVREEAISHYRDMLRLNPNDNQGIRYLLMEAYLACGMNKEARALHTTYKEDCMADWAWSNALLTFRTKGNTPSARTALESALKSNPHIPDYLLGRKKLPKSMPDYISPRDKTEAVAYVGSDLYLWKETAGALEWVGEVLKAG